MKQEMTSADVAALVFELSSGENSIIDSKIGKIYQPVAGELRINLFVYNKGKDNLVIEAGKRAHLSEHIRQSPKIPHSFPMLLRKHIFAGRITYVRQYDFDRIMEFGMVRGGVETVLVAELFSPGNIVLLDSERKIILPMKPVTFKGRKIRSGEVYQYPEAQLSPVEAGEKDLADVFSSSDADVVRTIANRFNLGGVLAEEVCFRAGIDKKTVAKDMNSEGIASIVRALRELFSPLIKGELSPYIVKKEIKGEVQPFDVAPFELKTHAGLEKEVFPSFNKALDGFFGKRAAEEVTEVVEAVKKEKVDVFERRLRKQEEAIGNFGREAERHVDVAEKIYAHYQVIEEVIGVLEKARQNGYSWDEIKSILKGAKETVPAAKSISSIDSATGRIVLDLDGTKATVDIKLTIPQNAQSYYEKAKKLTRKKEGAIRAIEDTKVAMQKKERKVSGNKRKVHMKKHWYDRFRWFYSSEGFLVVGGRDAETNEELVKKYMDKSDVVFHTQDPGAPMTIVKAQGKPVTEQTLMEAAQFVVSYSSVWKSGQFSGDCYWVLPEQVSKTPESGEYVKKGAFIIRGERNYFRDVQVGMAVALELGAETRVIGGPVSAVRQHGQHVIELIPGKFNQNDIAKKVYKMYVDTLKEVNFVKQIASPDRIAMMLPPGESDIKV
ncbi:MAG: ribosome rescue protein RqcH [Methanolobus sp.]|uniref:ribosome rescue protein RqcH n=1 Tax=Methanolobus sp. TaxID=1874737 RepID=UPI00272FAD34|nr:ribosome rescue protein RqcH [Methanolobus sp.]MDP2216829.1 ribosome rescue protein RqcH [Methanolobus sp.]